MHFGSPLAFLLLILAPLMLERDLLSRLTPRLFKSRRPVAAPGIYFSSSVDLKQLPRSWRSRLRSPLLSLLSTAAYCFLVVALARPQTASSFVEEQASGRDIMLVLDLSGSMEAMDFSLNDEQVNRLAALQHVVNKFIDARTGDRMGLVVFGDRVYTQCPLTLDHQMLKQYLAALRVGVAGQGTAIGDALGIALKRIKDIEGNSKVLVLVTDGKSNSGMLSPKQSAELARDLGVRIHAVGIGSADPAPFPVKTQFGETRMVMRPLEYDEATLTTIAETTGGHYFNARDTARLAEVYTEIDRLELREQKELRFVHYEEHFLATLAAGLALFFTAAVLELTLFMTVP